MWNQRTKSGTLRKTWTRPYVEWVGSLKLAEPSDELTLRRYFSAATEDAERAKRLADDCRAVAGQGRWKPYVDALCRLKGVDDVLALSYCASVGDFARFKNGRSVSSYFGLVPGRRDSGEKTGNNKGITKSGDAHVRRLVIEGLTSLPRSTGGPKRVRKGHEASPAVEAEALKCNARNRKRYDHLIEAGKSANVAKTAVASLLVRDMWFIGTMVGAELGKDG